MMPTVAEIFESMAWGPAPEAAEPAISWLEHHQRRFGHYIDGQWQSGEQTFQVTNPANRARLAEVSQGSAHDVDRAVTAARQAFPDWSATPGHVRARYLYALARQIQKHSRLFAVLETLDNGKPIRWSPDTSLITPAGRSSWPPSCLTTHPSASSDRSFPGISRY
jgi:aldehyde dehydrogenase (NAD+)